MAPKPTIKTGFTLLESAVALFLFVTGIFVVSQIYFVLIDSVVKAQNFQLALDNVRSGVEKIWNELKAGSEFSISSSTIDFLNRRCQKVSVSKQNDNLIFNQSPLFDTNLVKVNDFSIYNDVPSSTGEYYQTTYKLFFLYYDVVLKSKRGEIPLQFWQTVAPLNSVFLNPPCQ